MADLDPSAPRGPRDLADLVGATDLTRRIAIHDVELAWNEWGTRADAPPLLLCHGFSGSAHDFALHIPSLAADRRVIALDHRRHGRSTKTFDTAGHRVDL